MSESKNYMSKLCVHLCYFQARVLWWLLLNSASRSRWIYQEYPGKIKSDFPPAFSAPNPAVSPTSR